METLRDKVKIHIKRHELSFDCFMVKRLASTAVCTEKTARIIVFHFSSQLKIISFLFTEIKNTLYGIIQDF